MGICLIVFFFLLSLDILWRSRSVQRSFCEAFLTASIITGFLLATATEVLGYLHLITTRSVAVVWSLLLLLVLLLWLRHRPLRSKADDFRRFFVHLSRGEAVLLSMTLVYMSITGLIAFIAPPNTWDSMTYHMSRVMHWIQNHTVAHYPTAIDRQLFVNPFSEYVIMHFQLLTGNDRFANYVQWFSFAGCIAGAAFIADLLGADRRGQIYSMAVAASIPMAILQSTSTQTDLVVAFWGVCFVAFFLKWRTTQVPYDWACMTLSLGLTALTKTTGLFAVVPFGVWAVVAGFRRHKVKFAAVLLVSAVVVLLLVAPFLARNVATYHHPLGPNDVVEAANYLNAGYRTAFSSVILNLGLHLGTPFETVNCFLEKSIRAFHGMLGVKVDKRFFVRTSTSEDIAGNFWHLAFVVWAIFILPMRKQKSQVLFIYAALLILGFVWQSVTLGWSPWRSRYHTILFVLFAPLIGHAVNLLKGRQLCCMFIVFLVLTSAPSMCNNQSKPLFPQRSIFAESRIRQYFVGAPDFFNPYTLAADILRARAVSNIGLIMGADSWEYPFWVLLDPLRNGIRMEHINVDPNVSGMCYPLKAFSPDAILVSARETQPRRILRDGSVYIRVMHDNGVAVFLRDTAPGKHGEEQSSAP